MGAYNINGLRLRQFAVKNIPPLSPHCETYAKHARFLRASIAIGAIGRVGRRSRVPGGPGCGAAVLLLYIWPSGSGMCMRAWRGRVFACWSSYSGKYHTPISLAGWG